LIQILQNTFCHVPGISQNKEQELWNSDVLTWNDLLDKIENNHLSFKRDKSVKFVLNRSIDSLNNKNHEFFFNSLDQREHWRAYHDFKDKCCFLDIETTGLSKHHNDVTVVGLYDGNDCRMFVNGKNMGELKKAVDEYDMFVTYNGKCFDVPFLKAKNPLLNFDKFHVDLRFELRKLGLSGGLKHIEKEMGINRDDEIKEVDGFEAVRLWRRYKKGDKGALSTLINYNKADVVNLKTLMDFTYDKLKKGCLSNLC
jgi:uncharacterized protein